MTPHEARPGVGTLKVDIRLGKLGRFNRATGTDNPELAGAILKTLRRLAKERRYDLLGPLVDGLMTPMELHEAIWRGKIDQLPTPETAWPLHRTARRWVETLDLATRTKDAYEDALTGLGTEHTTLGEVPALLDERRMAALKGGKRPTFNRLHSAVMMFFTDRLGNHHPLTVAVGRIKRLDESADRREGNPFSLTQVYLLDEQFRKHGYGQHAGNLWALCLTGMRTSEYFGKLWRATGNTLEVLGTKTRAAKRAVPLAYPIARPSCSADHFRHIISKLTDKEHIPHDCRYTFMRWAENAGIPDLRIRWYAGHAVRSVTELYRRGRGFQEFLDADAQKLRAWFGEPPKVGLAMVRG